MISFIVPAHDEEQLLGRTLWGITDAARALDEVFEIVVADDASTDATPAIAERFATRVVRVDHLIVYPMDTGHGPELVGSAADALEPLRD